MQIIQEPGDPAHIGLVLSLDEYEILTSTLGNIRPDIVERKVNDKRYFKLTCSAYEFSRTMDNMYRLMSDLLEERGVWK